jgi:hypothetical protein
MRVRLCLPCAAAAVLACCNGPSEPLATLHTGLEGTVTRGPVMPVCLVGVPCDVPFSGGFTVRQGPMPVAVAHFVSDSTGRYRVPLVPGSYTVVPDSETPLVVGQPLEVTVGPVGITHADLAFDTGIR